MCQSEGDSDREVEGEGESVHMFVCVCVFVGLSEKHFFYPHNSQLLRKLIPGDLHSIPV